MAFSSPSNDQRNFECVTVASVDFIKLPLKDILESLIQPVDLFKGINLCPALLSGKFKLRQDQLKLCFIQPKAIPDYSKFDVTLLYTLIRNLCPSLKPTKGWGKDPDDADKQIGDDIERLRLFRNNYHAHADSAAISDAEFKDIWKKLKTVVYRIQKYMNNTGRNVDYEQELIKIESSRIAQDHLESCKLILQALMNIQKQTDLKDEPEIFLKVEDRVFCGDTARFEADVKNVEVSCWRSTWQKRTENSILECIDTNQEKYKGSTNIILLIQNVSKEDEGEYQAVISRVANGIEYRLSSNIVYLHALGELPILNDLRVTTGDEGITIHYSYKVLKQSPKVKHINWCKNGKPLDRKSKKYIGGSLNENCFTITSPTDDDRGTYKCTITNVVGSVSKEVIFGLPNIMASEETVIRNKSVKLVGNVFVYDGSPDILEVFWTKNGEKIDTQGSGGRLSTVTVDDPSLTIRDVSHIDAGEYKLIARNAVGTTSSDIITIGAPTIYLERLENERSGSQCFKATTKATPLPCSVQWSKKGNDEDEFKPIDANAEEFRGTTNYLPHPKLVVKDRTLLENNCFQIEVSNFIGSTVENISETKYQAELVCNFISSPGPQRVLLDCCLHFLIHNLKNPNDTWTKDKIVTHVRRMISKLVENNEKDRLEYFCQNLYQDESLSNTLLKCGEDFYALIFSMEEKYNAQDIILSEGSFCVTFCFENNLHLENFLKKLESKDEQLIKDLSKLTLNKTLLKIFSISPQQVWWTAWTVKVYNGTDFFEKIFTYPIEGCSEECSTTEPDGNTTLRKSNREAITNLAISEAEITACDAPSRLQKELKLIVQEPISRKFSEGYFIRQSSLQEKLNIIEWPPPVETKSGYILHFTCFSGESLSQLSLRKCFGDPNDQKNTTKYSRLVHHAVQFISELHESGWILRDICCQNLYFDSNNQKVFSTRQGRMAYISSKEDPDDIIIEEVFQDHKNWLPLEILRHGEYTKEGDVYMLAMAIYEFYMGLEINLENPTSSFMECVPFCRVPRQELIDRLLSGEVPHQPMFCPGELYEIMEICWNRDRTRRPTCAEILQVTTRLVLDSELSPPDYASFSSELLNQSRKVSLPTRPTKVHEYQTNKISSRSSSFSSYVSSDSYSSFANSDSD